MAKTATLNIYQGDDYAAVVTVLDSNGQPADLTGYTAQAQIRHDVADVAPTVVIEIPTTITLPNQITLAVAHVFTTPLSGPYKWDLQITDASNIITTLLYGPVQVILEVTREGALQSDAKISEQPSVRTVTSPVGAVRRSQVRA